MEDKTLQLQLITHPDYPSLKSVSDTFDYFGIENIVAKVPREALQQLPKLFIALIEKEGKTRLFLVKQGKNAIVTIDEQLQKEKWEVQSFKEKWEGTIIAVESKNNSTGPKKVLTVKNTVYLLFGILISGVLFLNSLPSILYPILSLVGLLTSYFIVRESIGANSAGVSKVCDVLSKNKGCSAVVNTSRNTLFGLISLSDACLVYFSSLVLITSLLGFDYTISFYLSFLSIPVVLYTLVQQAFVLKEWCVLCLAISAVLILQFLLLLGGHFDEAPVRLLFVFKSLFIVAVVVVVWNFLKTFWMNNLRLEKMESDFIKFKRNTVVFDTLLNEKKLIKPNIITTKNKIIFGSRTPRIRIDAVTNPLCGFCVESFRVYYQLLTTQDDVQVNFIFTMFTSQVDNPAYLIIQSVVSIYRNNGEEKALVALNEWFMERNFEKWYSKFGAGQSDLDISYFINEHQDWIRANNVALTPTTILNGHFFPKEYEVKDLLLFIDDIQSEHVQPALNTI